MTTGVIIRLVLSLTVVIGGLLAVRWWGLRGAGRFRGIQVVARASLGRSASVAVLEVAGRRYLVGAAEQSVNLLAELDPDIDLGGSPVTDATTGTTNSTAPAASKKSSSGEGSPSGLFETHDMPRTGLIAQLRRMTTRVPQGVRIHALDD
jgi:flagellar biogenesis protein FliO